jgi:hypothetical protein
LIGTLLTSLLTVRTSDPYLCTLLPRCTGIHRIIVITIMITLIRMLMRGVIPLRRGIVPRVLDMGLLSALKRNATYRFTVEVILTVWRLEISTVDNNWSVHDPIEDPQAVHVATQPLRCCNRRRACFFKGLSKLTTQGLWRRMNNAGVQSIQLSSSTPRWPRHFL